MRQVKYDINRGVKRIKTKVAIAITAVGLILGGGGLSIVMLSTAHASVPTVPGGWQITAPSTVDFTCGGGHYIHTLDTVLQNSSGSFTGTGHYNPDASYTWNASGNVTGDNLSFTITYTGTAAGSVYNLAGTIASDGSVSGVVDSNCQSFTMPAGSLTRFEGNHGQYVSSQTDKQAAAQSRVGMPVQSNGHTH